jgi:hypothetical protein
MDIKWQDIVFYTFLSYFLIHLIIDDILLIIKFIKGRDNNLINETNQRTLIIIFNKICDVVSKAVDGYFTCFENCWNKVLECLQIIICAYLTFLTGLCKDLLTFPTVIYVCTASVLIVAIIPTIFYVILM